MTSAPDPGIPLLVLDVDGARRHRPRVPGPGDER